jgi:hypothetical protein
VQQLSEGVTGLEPSREIVVRFFSDSGPEKGIISGNTMEERVRCSSTAIPDKKIENIVLKV